MYTDIRLHGFVTIIGGARITRINWPDYVTGSITLARRSLSKTIRTPPKHSGNKVTKKYYFRTDDYCVVYCIVCSSLHSCQIKTILFYFIPLYFKPITNINILPPSGSVHDPSELPIESGSSLQPRGQSSPVYDSYGTRNSSSSSIQADRQALLVGPWWMHCG